MKPTLEITEEIVENFKTFVESKDFDYKTSLQIAMENLQKEIDEEDNTEKFETSMADLIALIEKEKDNDFEESMPYIKKTIKREIVSAIAGEKGVYEEIILKTDKTIKRAIEILTSPNEYSHLLSNGQKKAELN